MNIGEKLKLLRENNNMTRKEVTVKLKEFNIDISDKTLYGYESGRNSANADMFLALCKIYKCNNIMETFSSTVDDVLFTNEEWKIIEKYRTLDEYGKETVNIILDRETSRVEQAKKDHERSIKRQKTRIIQYYQRLASAGTGQFVFDDIPVDLIEIPDIPEYKDGKYAIGVNGASMEPLYHNGDILLVEPSEDVEIDEIGIFIVDGYSYVKKRGKDELISLNDNYPNIPLTESSGCLGRVIDKISDVPFILDEEDWNALKKASKHSTTKEA